VDQQSLQVPASTVSDYIDHQLSEMEAEYRMYDHDRVENGEDAFPDACEGCPHYGGGCPIITWRSPQRSWIESPSRPRTATFKKKFAGSPPCTTVTAFRRGSRSGRRGMRGLVEEGWDIYLSIEIDVGLMDSPGAEMKVDLSADDDGGGY